GKVEHSLRECGPDSRSESATLKAPSPHRGEGSTVWGSTTMFGRYHPAWLPFAGSALVLGVLVGLLYCDSLPPGQGPSAEPLIVQCAAAVRVPMEAIKHDYEQETSQRIELRFGASETILTSLKLTRQGDLFLPADDSYVEQAKQL